MTITYYMRAWKLTSPTGYVYWNVTGVPDMTGASSGYPTSSLTDIVITNFVDDSSGGGGGGGAPTGPAGGDLRATYPNPVVAGLQTVKLASNSPGQSFLPIYDTSFSGYDIRRLVLGDINFGTDQVPSINLGTITLTGQITGSGSGGVINTTIGSINLFGDVTGTPATTTVVKINGTSVPATPTANTVLIASSGTVATWAQIANANISNTAAIAGTKISPNFGTQNVITTGTLGAGLTTVTNLVDSALTTGVVHSSSSGLLSSSLIVNTDVAAGAAIDGSKINPNFVGQNIITTGTLSAGATTVTSLKDTGMVTGIVVSDGYGNLTSVTTLAPGVLPNLAGDVTGPFGTTVVASISGASPINITPSNLRFLTTTSTPTISQADSSANTVGQIITIQAQNVTGATSTGGSVALIPGTGVTANGSVLLQNASSVTIAKVTDNKFYTLKGYSANITSVTGAYTILQSDYIIAVGTIASGVTITLPLSPVRGDTYEIVDAAGTAATKNITVSGNGINVVGSPTYVMTINYSALLVIYNSTTNNWMII